MTLLLEALFQILFEGYKEAQTEFAIASDPTTTSRVIDQYRDLVNRNQVQGDERNIDWWRKQGWEAFKTFVEVKSQQKSITQIKRSKLVGKSITVEETNKWLIVIPIDKDASCYHGKNTDWCTTKPNKSYFEDYFYKKRITLMYFLKVDTNEKWAVAYYTKTAQNSKVQHSDWMECFDQRDTKISPTEFKQQTGLDPLEYQKHVENSDNVGLVTTQRKDYKKVEKLLQSQQPFTVKSDEVEHALVITKNLDLISDYLVATGRSSTLEQILLAGNVREFVGYLTTIKYVGKHPELEKAIVREARTMDSEILHNLILTYTRYILGARWHAGEQLLLSKPNYSHMSEYETYVVRTEWDDFTRLKRVNPNMIYQTAVAKDHRASPEQELLIANDPTIALEYADNVIKARWPAGEAAIATNASVALQYINMFIKARWPEAEAAIAANTNTALFYIEKYVKARWPEAEAAIATNSAHALEYVDSVINTRWPAGEAAIATDATTAMAYIERYIKARWVEAEAVIAKDPKLAVQYAKKYISGRWLDAEKVILANPSTAIGYVINNMKHRVPELESEIVKAPISAIAYAKTFFKGKGWVELEQVLLASDGTYISNYAVGVLGKPWPEGERVLLSNKNLMNAIKYAGMVYKGVGWTELEQKIVETANLTYKTQYRYEVFGKLT